MKVNLGLKNKQDCIMYLAHILEYGVKKCYILEKLIQHALLFADRQIESYEGENTKELILYLNEHDIDISFENYKVITSALNLVENDLLNLIGDYDSNKYAVSYINFLNVVNSEKKIEGVKLKFSGKKKSLIKEFNKKRNYMHHLTGAKFDEWIKARENQVKNGEAKFEFDSNFNIYISEYVGSKTLAYDIMGANYILIQAKEILKYMQKDYEILLGKKVNINIYKKHRCDNSHIEISNNGFKRHMK